MGGPSFPIMSAAAALMTIPPPPPAVAAIRAGVVVAADVGVVGVNLKRAKSLVVVVITVFSRSETLGY